MWDSKKRKHICERCGSVMDVTASYPDHQNLYCPKCQYRDTFPKISGVIKKVKKK